MNLLQKGVTLDAVSSSRSNRSKIRRTSHKSVGKESQSKLYMFMASQAHEYSICAVWLSRLLGRTVYRLSIQRGNAGKVGMNSPEIPRHPLSNAGNCDQEKFSGVDDLTISEVSLLISRINMGVSESRLT